MQVARVQNSIPQARLSEGFVKSSFTEQQPTLGREIIPAVRGEYYGYSAIFTREQPIYALLKCKSNKAWPISVVANLGAEANAFFQLNERDQKIFSIKTADSLGLLQRARSKVNFNDIWFTPIGLTAKQFMELQTDKDEKELVSLCKKALVNGHDATEIYKGLVVAMMTSSKKYGMFLVSKVAPFSIQIEACHILV